MKIVKFKDGTYGVRKWTLFGYEFFGLKGGGYWWPIKYKGAYCKGTYEEAAEAYDALNDKGVPVKIKS